MAVPKMNLHSNICSIALLGVILILQFPAKGQETMSIAQNVLSMRIVNFDRNGTAEGYTDSTYQTVCGQSISVRSKRYLYNMAGSQKGCTEKFAVDTPYLIKDDLLNVEEFRPSRFRAGQPDLPGHWNEEDRNRYQDSECFVHQLSREEKYYAQINQCITCTICQINERKLSVLEYYMFSESKRIYYPQGVAPALYWTGWSDEERIPNLTNQMQFWPACPFASNVTKNYEPSQGPSCRNSKLFAKRMAEQVTYSHTREFRNSCQVTVTVIPEKTGSVPPLDVWAPKDEDYIPPEGCGGTPSTLRPSSTSLPVSSTTLHLSSTLTLPPNSTISTTTSVPPRTTLLPSSTSLRDSTKSSSSTTLNSTSSSTLMIPTQTTILPSSGYK